MFTVWEIFKKSSIPLGDWNRSGKSWFFCEKFAKCCADTRSQSRRDWISRPCARTSTACCQPRTRQRTVIIWVKFWFLVGTILLSSFKCNLNLLVFCSKEVLLSLLAIFCFHCFECNISFFCCLLTGNIILSLFECTTVFSAGNILLLCC